jgi:4-aminobutyrate aminotransferase-like enzyme
MFACERLGVVPDLLTAAKSMAGGLPLAAVVGRASIMNSVGKGGVGSTFAGNPIACAAALESIGILERLVAAGRPDAIGERIRERMLRLQKELPRLGEVRGLGAMQAIELVRDPQTKAPAADETRAVLAAARERGVLLLSAGTYGNVVRFLTPLSIADEVLDEGLAITEQALRRVLT